MCTAIAVSQTAANPSSMDLGLLRMTNAARAERGLAPLQWDSSLAAAARTHAALIVERGQLTHQLPGEPDLALRAAQAGAHFQVIAENIAEGPGLESIQNGWMRSPPHRANILDPKLNTVGFAIVGHDGSYYAVADFSHSVPMLSRDQVEAAIKRLLLTRGVQATGPVRDARQSCEMDHGTAPGSSPHFIMRWQGADLSRLPDALEKKIRDEGFQIAAVGACDRANPENGFTTYRVAVLLY